MTLNYRRSAWLSTVFCVLICCFVNLLAVVVQSLPGVRLGGVSFGEPLVQGKKKKKKKKGNHGHNYPSSSGISNSLFFLSADSTVMNDLICTTPRLCQNNKTPVALRGRGTTSAYNCFPATGLYFKSKVFASVGRGSTETTRLQHGSSMFGDTHAKGGGGDLATSMATWLSSSLRNENGKLKIFVVRTTLLAKSHRC